MNMSEVEIELHRQLGEIKGALRQSEDRNAELERQLQAKTLDSLQKGFEFQQQLLKKDEKLNSLNDQVKEMKNKVEHIAQLKASSAKEATLRLVINKLKKEQDFLMKKAEEVKREMAKDTNALMEFVVDLVCEKLVEKVVQETQKIVQTCLEADSRSNSAGVKETSTNNQSASRHQSHLFRGKQDVLVDGQQIDSFPNKRLLQDDRITEREHGYRTAKKPRRMHSRRDSLPVENCKDKSRNGNVAQQGGESTKGSRTRRSGTSGTQTSSCRNDTQGDRNRYKRQRSPIAADNNKKHN